MLWGARGFVETYDVPGVWSEYAADLRTARIDAGHFLPEEAPAEVTEPLVRFLRGE